jgi:DNA repair photolyase
VRLALHPDVDRALPLVERHTVSDAWAVNTYVACDIRCTHCITSAQGRSTPRYPADAVARQLRQELDAIEEVDRPDWSPVRQRQARASGLHGLAARGVRVLVQATPWIPGITDVLALRKRIDGTIPIQVTPLRLPTHLSRATRSLGLTQTQVNDAYGREYERVGPLPKVRWSRPPPIDGTAPHIIDNIGRFTMSDWTPAPTAPDPGPRRAWMHSPP